MLVPQICCTVSMATLVRFPADPQIDEALLEAFAKRIPLIRAHMEMNGDSDVELPVELAIA